MLVTSNYPRNHKIGIIGGGQLGMLLADRCAELNLPTTVLDPNPECSAKRSATSLLTANFTDDLALQKLGALTTHLTYEFENIPVKLLANYHHICPSLTTLWISQDRSRERAFFSSLNAAVPRWILVQKNLMPPLSIWNHLFPEGCILKSRTGGYDGKNQIPLSFLSKEFPATATDFINTHSSLAEERINFSKEVSLTGVRTQNGKIICYPFLHLNYHQQGILRESQPLVDENLLTSAIKIFRDFTTAFNHFGILTIEFFVVNDQLIVNEIAPRVHNSGHHTVVTTNFSQFALAIAVLTNANIPPLKLVKKAVMFNVLGQNYADFQKNIPACYWTNYYKTPVKNNRKMAHVTIPAAEVDLVAKARKISRKD